MSIQRHLAPNQQSKKTSENYDFRLWNPLGITGYPRNRRDLQGVNPPSRLVSFGTLRATSRDPAIRRGPAPNPGRAVPHHADGADLTTLDLPSNGDHRNDTQSYVTPLCVTPFHVTPSILNSVSDLNPASWVVEPMVSQSVSSPHLHLL